MIRPKYNRQSVLIIYVCSKRNVPKQYMRQYIKVMNTIFTRQHHHIPPIKSHCKKKSCKQNTNSYNMYWTYENKTKTKCYDLKCTI